MDNATGFHPESLPNARVLILGSMPGQRSLAEHRYYAHSRNAFWTIMGELFNAGPEKSYSSRLATLKQQGIALWDVLQYCERPGSLDSAIRADSAVANDFATFFKKHPQIHSVYFNGKKARELYNKHYPQNVHRLVTLPSTSPANAAICFATKLDAWSCVREAL